MTGVIKIVIVVLDQELTRLISCVDLADILNHRFKIDYPPVASSWTFPVRKKLRWGRWGCIASIKWEWEGTL
jgi:hypothetical protein